MKRHAAVIAIAIAIAIIVALRWWPSPSPRPSPSPSSISPRPLTSFAAHPPRVVVRSPERLALALAPPPIAAPRILRGTPDDVAAFDRAAATIWPNVAACHDAALDPAVDLEIEVGVADGVVEADIVADPHVPYPPELVACARQTLAAMTPPPLRGELRVVYELSLRP